MRKSLLTFLLVLGMLLPGCNAAPEETLQTTEQVTSEPVEPTEIVWTPVYNPHECGLQATRLALESRELTEEELKTIVPAELLTGREIRGWIYFNEDKSMNHITVRIPDGDEYVTVTLGDDVSWNGCCISVSYEKGETSPCASVEYTLFRKDNPTGSVLIATGEINGVPVLARMDTKDPDNDIIVFEEILETFAVFKGTSLSLSQIQ